ncbi:MAG: AAA family ATPase, partial [Saprospiraceae bacterium]|nr:AAA family ATPase [Saprospiraceae bacterium]
NIADNLTLDLNLHDLMGFREEEVGELLRLAGAPEAEYARILDDMRAWYNGYRFHEEAPQRLYNPDMVLYFVKEYAQYRKYPRYLLDGNVASDYHKIGQRLRVGNEVVNRQVVEEVLREGAVQAALTIQYSFARPWTRDDFASLLFYLGMLTIRQAVLTQLVLEMPNRVMEGLYFDFFYAKLLEESQL